MADANRSSKNRMGAGVPPEAAASTPSSNLVTELRSGEYGGPPEPLLARAADEIERLTRELTEAQASINRWMEDKDEAEQAFATCSQERMRIAMDRQRLRAALERVCAVDKAAPGRRDCDIWAEMLAEAAEALRGESSDETGTEPEPVAFVGYVNEQPDIIYPGTTRLEGRRYLPIWRPEDHPCARRDAQKTPETADDPLEHSKVILDEILAERGRQVTRLGWTPQHDDEHDDRALARAAATYVLHYTHRAVFAKSDPSAYQEEAGAMDAACWPDGWEFKPKAPHWDLIRAAALIVAELERLDRSSSQKAGDER